MPTASYQTLGCKVNSCETERVRETLERAGFATVPFSTPADVCFINTCSVTAVADSKSRAAVRRALRANPGAFVVVSGCYSELEPVEIRQIEGVGLVLPNEQKHTAAERICAHLGVPLPDSESPSPTVRPRVRTRAVVKVQDGCDAFCSYCIIPYARSRKYSRPMDEVRAELEALAGFGYREVVLAGIRLGSYEANGGGLSELARMAVSIEGIERVRLSSVEPWEVDGRLLEAMAHPSVCRHLHIPMQSGDATVLERMGRPYTPESYAGTVRRVREAIPGIGVTTDVIVGFPGESDEAYEATERFVREMAFSRVHVFRYSPRPRTRAAGFSDQVEPGKKKTRAQRLAAIAAESARDFAQSWVGQTLDVLAESQTGPERLRGFADNYLEVVLTGPASLKGRIVRARIVGVGPDGRAEAVPADQEAAKGR